MWLRGNDLNEEQRKKVFTAFIYRWTKDNKQRTQVYSCGLCDIHNPYENTKSANNHTHPTIPLISDEEWLKQYAFDFTEKDELNPKRNHCEPVWLHFN